MKEEIDDRIVKEVISSYEMNHSVNATANDCVLSTVKVRKILITYGMWESSTSRSICDLVLKGYTVSQIAAELGMSENNVLAYTPYEKGIYLKQNRSADAMRSQKYRDNMKNKLLNQIHVDYWENFDVRNPWGVEKRVIPYVVRTELYFESLNGEDREVLKKYGKCSDGKTFVRDIVVPGDFPLYALHYAIQRLYGWTNSHLRRFYLPEDRMEMLTGNKVAEFMKLVGILFRYPDDEIEGYFCNDDYREGMSYRNWLRKKYTGPYYEISEDEFYVKQHKWALQFKRENKSFYAWHDSHNGKTSEVSYDEAQIRDAIEYGDGDLLFRLPLAMILAESGTKLYDHDAWKYSLDKKSEDNPIFCHVTDKLLYEYDYGDGWKITITRPKGVEFSDRIFREVMESHRPVCIHKDGIMLMDDVGGTFGFVEFLKHINNYYSEDDKKYEDPEEWLSWAVNVQGWSKRNISLENML